MEDTPENQSQLSSQPAICDSESIGDAVDEVLKSGVAKQIASMESDLDPHVDEFKPWMKRFIAALRIWGVETLACSCASVSISIARKHRDENPTFARMWDEANDYNHDLMKARWWQLAVEGVDEPIFQGGIQVGTKRVISERLLELGLRAYKKEFARDQRSMVDAIRNQTAGQPAMDMSQVAELVKALSPTLAAGVIASRQKSIDVQAEVIKSA